MTKRKQIAARVEEQMLRALDEGNQPTTLLWSMYRVLCLPSKKDAPQRQADASSNVPERTKHAPPASKPVENIGDLH